MKLGSLKEGGRDGTLIVVSRNLSRAVKATGIAPTMQRALEDWESTAPRLNSTPAATAPKQHRDRAFLAIKNSRLREDDVAPV